VLHCRARDRTLAQVTLLVRPLRRPFRLARSAAPSGGTGFIAETFALISWLTESTDERERRKRAYRFLLACIERTRNTLRHAPDPEPSTLRSLKRSADELRQIARDDGIQGLRGSPDAPYLFKNYLEPGYVLFAMLSEIGSHPGLLQILVFHQDRASRRIDVDLGGQHDERAAWANAGIDFFGRTCDSMGKWFGWEDWLQGTLLPIVHEALPLMTEASARWARKWGMSSESHDLARRSPPGT
jgi:hypothetical protein